MTPSVLQRRFLDALRGVVFPIPTAFGQDGSVDLEATAAYVRALVARGVRAVMVTVGTSRFSLLSVDEMLAVNAAVAGAKGDALCVVTAPGTGATDLAVEFARHAAACGADAVLGVYPERWYGDDAVFDYFQALAGASSIGVMIHLMAMPAGRGGFGPQVQYSPELVERIAALPTAVGMKEESGDKDLALEYVRRVGGRFVVMGGRGGMGSHLEASAWGQPAYLAGIGNFAPEVELEFSRLVEAGDREGAARLVREYEKPFFEVAVPPGWHPALKEGMRANGLMAAWERAPLACVAGAEAEAVRRVALDISRRFAAEQGGEGA